MNEVSSASHESVLSLSSHDPLKSRYPKEIERLKKAARDAGKKEDKRGAKIKKDTKKL